MGVNTGDARLIKVTVTTIWQGKVAVRAKYVHAAKRFYQPLLIVHGKDSMTIRNKEIDKLVVAQSERKVSDRYNGEPPDYLFYFAWKPDPEQGVLRL